MSTTCADAAATATATVDYDAKPTVFRRHFIFENTRYTKIKLPWSDHNYVHSILIFGNTVSLKIRNLTQSNIPLVTVVMRYIW